MSMEDVLVRCERCGEVIPYDIAYRSTFSGGYLCDICYDDLYS